LEKYKADKGKEFDSREQIFIPKWQRLEQLKELAVKNNLYLHVTIEGENSLYKVKTLKTSKGGNQFG